jgi:hypothetical protein
MHNSQDFKRFMANRQELVNLGQSPTASINIKYMTHQDIQKYGMMPNSGVTSTPKGVSYHAVSYNANTADPKKAIFGFDNGTMVISGIKDTNDINKQSNISTTTQQPSMVSNYTTVQFNMEYDPEKQKDPVAMEFLHGMNFFDYDVEQYVAQQIAQKKVATQVPKYSGVVQRAFSIKSNVTENGQSMAGQPMKIPIIRATIKLAKKADGSKIPTTKIYDVRESFKNFDPTTGQVKWVEAKINGEPIDGNNWMNYLNYNSKIWMIRGSYEVNQSNFGISSGFNIWHIAVEYNPVDRDVQTVLNPELIERMKALGLTEAPVITEVEADPFADAIVGRQTIAAFLQNVAQPSPAPTQSQQTTAAFPQNVAQSAPQMPTATPQMPTVTPQMPTMSTATMMQTAPPQMPIMPTAPLQMPITPQMYVPQNHDMN